MKPAEWLRSKHGAMLMKALDDQVLPTMAKYHRLDVGIPDLLAVTRLVMEEQLLHHGKPGKLPQSLVQGRAYVNENGVLCGYARELEEVVHRLCVTWLVGNVETVDRSLVNWTHVSAVFRRWREKTGSSLLSNGPEYLRRILRWRRAGAPR
jgi:hypothetical protein